MRLKFLFLLACLCSAGVHAADKPPAADAPPPPPLDARDPPPATNAEAGDAPQVTITKEGGETVQEYRVGGRLFMIKITPKAGPPYYLVDDVGDGKFTRRDTVDSEIRPPRWVLFRF